MATPSLTAGGEGLDELGPSPTNGTSACGNGASGREVAPDVRRAYFLDRLDALESEASRDFADGGLKGEGLLALVNDTRSSRAAGNRTPRLLPTPIDIDLSGNRPAAGPPNTPCHPAPSGRHPGPVGRPRSDHDFGQV